MVNAGLLERFGARRGTYYRAADPLRVIWEDVRKNRKPINGFGALRPAQLYSFAPSNAQARKLTMDRAKSGSAMAPM